MEKQHKQQKELLRNAFLNFFKCQRDTKGNIIWLPIPNMMTEKSPPQKSQATAVPKISLTVFVSPISPSHPTLSLSLISSFQQWPQSINLIATKTNDDNQPLSTLFSPQSVIETPFSNTVPKNSCLFLSSFHTLAAPIQENNNSHP